jgi:uroporphyrin-III C-methyltransferase/precorrin-2 dehydrogenase/sirohydrochlorin ferrochelatase
VTPPLFPAFLKLEGRDVLVVGGGSVAASKALALLAAGARVRVVAPKIDASMRGHKVAIAARRFRATDLDGAWFVVAAATPVVNRQVARAAASRRVFVNAVDDPSAASAYLGAVLRRDGVTLAVSTDGAAPALAGLLRQGLEALLPRDLSTWVRTAKRLRPGWRRAKLPHPARRPRLLLALNSLYRSAAVGGAAVGARSRST